MKEMYFLPITKVNDEFFQQFTLEEDDLSFYHVDNYSKIIEEKCYREEAIVNLHRGRFKTLVFAPKNEQEKFFFCLVNEKGLPQDAQEIEVDDSYIEELRKVLSLQVLKSEGIFKEQEIDILSEFVTPRIYSKDSENEMYYHFHCFENSNLIFGAPGSGKTTMLRKIALDYISENFDHDKNLNKFPIYIQLRDFNNYKSDFNTYIDTCINNTLYNIKFLDHKTVKFGGNLCLLLDGADEIDFDKFSSFETTINEFRHKNPLTSLIITSRPDRKMEQLKEFKKWYVQPFNENQIKDLTYRKLSRGGKWKEFISVLNSAPGVNDVLKNPLLLTIAHFLFTHKSIIPINSGQLIKELVSALVDNWDSNRNIERKLKDKKVSAIEITNFLGKLSLQYSQIGRDALSTEQIFEKINDFPAIEDLDLYLDYIEFSTGIIHKSNNRWKFQFRAIQDYLCSSYLVEGVQNLNKELFTEKNWNRILMMISGLNSDPNYILKAILESDEITKLDKVEKSLAIMKESHLLKVQDIEKSFKLLEEFFVNFESVKNIEEKSINFSAHEETIRLILETKGSEDIINLMKTIYQIRYTKYEYNFYGYLKNSRSKILKSVSYFTEKNGNIDIDLKDDEILIRYKEESPNIVD
ncbi:hypothetical protein BCY89_05910 [Sphingobacterium siyangense]|uniref:NACHT domain-containing protein n=1 Tax=Sphingobacterium siyangense TaxID=459529 RepID=A0A420FWE5_9SPHI|nr:hypothetical protein BCY89_05910 [Sphingobacterium siyangense]